MLELQKVSRSFGAKRAVDDVSLSIPRRQMVAVIGRSGAGKSTLLRMINRLVDPSAGSIRFEGTDVTRLSGSELRDWRRRSAMIFQQFNLVGRLDVMTNVLMGRVGHVSSVRTLTRLWPERDRAIALSALECRKRAAIQRYARPWARHQTSSLSLSIMVTNAASERHA